jgi:FMN phosphatase YigB (HAD superfamily)
VLGQLRQAGFWLGLAGNQTKRAGEILRELSLPVDLVATSDDWGVSKPDPGFFARLAGSAPYASSEILYVGDRLDNDIRPASRAGMHTALIRRGPWGFIQERDPAADRLATMRVRSLDELPGKIAAFNAGAR